MTKLYATAWQRDADRIERTGKVSCLGPEGSYSELAAREMCKGEEIVLTKSFGEAVEKLLAGETDHAVLPVENSLNGGVYSVLDLLSDSDLFGESELLLQIDHRLALKEGVRAEDVETVYSHEQALGQCSEYLRTHFPHAALVGTSSTAESLNKLDSRSAGIVGAHLKREGIVLSDENIADNKQNFTRFLKVRRGVAEISRSAMVFLCAVCAHKPGSLLGLLRIFQRFGLNLTRIESRPVKGSFGQYRFFIEFAGDIASERVQNALAEAKVYCSQFKLIGAYL